MKRKQKACQYWQITLSVEAWKTQECFKMQKKMLYAQIYKHKKIYYVNLKHLFRPLVHLYSLPCFFFFFFFCKVDREALGDRWKQGYTKLYIYITFTAALMYGGWLVALKHCISKTSFCVMCTSPASTHHSTSKQSRIDIVATFDVGMTSLRRCEFAVGSTNYIDTNVHVC